MNQDGLSWTLNREIAISFPFLNRYRTDQPMLLTATVSRDRIAALKLDRDEQEVIVIDLAPSCWTVEYLTEPPQIN